MHRDGETYRGKVKKSSTYINRILTVLGLELSGFMIFPHSLLTLSFHLEFTQMKRQVQLWFIKRILFQHIVLKNLVVLF